MVYEGGSGKNHEQGEGGCQIILDSSLTCHLLTFILFLSSCCNQPIPDAGVREASYKYALLLCAWPAVAWDNPSSSSRAIDLGSDFNHRPEACLPALLACRQPASSFPTWSGIPFPFVWLASVSSSTGSVPCRILLGSALHVSDMRRCGLEKVVLLWHSSMELLKSPFLINCSP